METFDVREWKKKQLLKEEHIREETSLASQQAKKKGLKSVGWGRWADKNGNVVAKTEDDKLVFMKPQPKANATIAPKGKVSLIKKNTPGGDSKSPTVVNLMKLHSQLANKYGIGNKKTKELFGNKIQQLLGGKTIIAQVYDPQTDRESRKKIVVKKTKWGAVAMDVLTSDGKTYEIDANDMTSIEIV